MIHYKPNFSQTYYACDGRIFSFDMVRKRFDLFKDQPANIRMPTTPVHNSGLNMVALGYNSAFFIANIYVSNLRNQCFLDNDISFNEMLLILAEVLLRTPIQTFQEKIFFMKQPPYGFYEN